MNLGVQSLKKTLKTPALSRELRGKDIFIPKLLWWTLLYSCGRCVCLVMSLLILSLQRLTTHFCPIVQKEQHLGVLSGGVNHTTHSQEHNLITVTHKEEQSGSRQKQMSWPRFNILLAKSQVLIFQCMFLFSRAPICFSDSVKPPRFSHSRHWSLSVFLSLICLTGFK